MALPGVRAGGQSQRLHRRQRRRQQLVGAVGRNFGTKREFQTNHSVTGSITKVRGRWNHKAGVEYRNLLSNYWDLEQASVAMPSPFAHSGGNFNFQYATASGGVASLVTTNAQRGVNAAGHAARDRRVVDSARRERAAGAVAEILRGLFAERLAGLLEADDQPRPAVGSSSPARPSASIACRRGTSRPRMRSAPRARLRSRVSTATAGTCGTPPTTTGDRESARRTRSTTAPSFAAASASPICPATPAISRDRRTMARPTSPAGVTQTAYGTTPRGVPVIRFSDPAPIAPAIGGDPTAPQVYGIGEARFDRHFKNGQARQWNFFIERSLFKNWMASIGYTASVSRNLFNRSYPDPEPAEHPCGHPRPVARPVHRQQRHAQSVHAARAQPVPARERPAPAVRRRAGCGDDRAAEHAASRIRC